MLKIAGVANPTPSKTNRRLKCQTSRSVSPRTLTVQQALETLDRSLQGLNMASGIKMSASPAVYSSDLPKSCVYGTNAYAGADENGVPCPCRWCRRRVCSIRRGRESLLHSICSPRLVRGAFGWTLGPVGELSRLSIIAKSVSQSVTDVIVPPREQTLGGALFY